MFVERFIGWIDTAGDKEKAAATNALGRAFLISPMSEDERDAAEAAMTVLLDDPDVNIRLALADAFGHSDQAPRHIVLALADDVPSVSVPLLGKSPVLLECELNNFIKKGYAEQQFAIACRDYIAHSTCTLIAKHGPQDVCLAMLLNIGAHISGDAFNQIAERHGDNNDVRSCLLAREDVPMTARIMLIEKYALSLLPKAKEETEHETNKRLTEMQEACDKATITFAAQVNEQELCEIVDALIATARLNTGFLLRAICMGNIALFANALSALANVPLDRVERVLADDRRKTFAAIYQRSDLPAAAFSVFHFAICSWRTVLLKKSNTDSASLCYFVTRDTLANYQATENESGPIVDQLLLLLRRICTHAARESARNKVELINKSIAQKALVLEAEKEKAPVLTDVELADFAVNLAEELAEQLLEQDLELAQTEDNLEPSNNNIKEEDPTEILAVVAA